MFSSPWDRFFCSSPTSGSIEIPTPLWGNFKIGIMKRKLLIGVALFASLSFASTPKVENRTAPPSGEVQIHTPAVEHQKVKLPPVVREFLRGLEEGLARTLGEGSLKVQKQLVQTCQSLMEGISYVGVKGRSEIEMLLLSNSARPVFWVIAKGVKTYIPPEVGKVEELQLAVGENWFSLTFRGVEEKTQKGQLLLKIPSGEGHAFVGNSSLRFGVSALVYSPLFPPSAGLRYADLEGGAYADWSSGRGKLFGETLLDGFFSTDLVVEFSSLSPQVVEELKRLAQEGKNAKLSPESAILKIVPERVVLKIEVGPLLRENLKKELSDLKGELKNYENLKGIGGQLARALFAVIEGRADGLKIEVENRQRLNFGQLISLFTMLALSENPEKAEQLLEGYFSVKISTL